MTEIPLSIILQGQRNTSSDRTIFLFPDGSGSGMAYSSLPLIHPDACLVAMNSPFLAQPETYKCSIEDLTRLWIGDIRKRQPRGPYRLGGWSAGGYYAFEMAKVLIEAGEEIDMLILIDSPCRLRFEALPMRTVEILSEQHRMGKWTESSSPRWMIEHFRSTIAAIEAYTPTPAPSGRIRKVFLIWAQNGVFEETGDLTKDIDFGKAINRLLLRKRPEVSALGWENLLPGSAILAATTPGNHFQIIHPPYCQTLSSLLRSTWILGKTDT